MSQPERIVTLQTPLSVVIEGMLQFEGRCLPVTTNNAKVIGLVTVFDVLRLLMPREKIPHSRRTSQALCVMV